MIGSIAARIPWQNILTAPLSMTVEGLDIAFTLCPPSNDPSAPVDHLAESLVAVAQEFTHQALSPDDNEVLRESIMLAKEEEQLAGQVPGSLDPFSSESHDVDSTEPLDTFEGVSVLASVVERLLARLQFSAEDLTLRIVHEHHTEIVLHVDRVTYGSEEAEGDLGSEEVRSIRTEGVTIAMRNPRLQLPSPTPSSSTLAPPSHSVVSSDTEQEDEDEEMDAFMTQSMVSLRQDSPESSLYMSATSSLRPPSPEPELEPVPELVPTIQRRPTTPPSRPIIAPSDTSELVLSFGHDPIILRLRTPRPSAGISQSPNDADISLSLEAGVIAVVLQPRHIRSLLEISAYISPPSRLPPTSPHPPSHPPPISSPSFIDAIKVSLAVRSIVALLLQAEPPTLSTSEFFAKPRSTILQLPYVRISIDSPSASLSRVHDQARSLDASIEDLSIFIIHSLGPDTWVASPLWIFDSNLSTQYSTNIPFPEFAVVDWTGSKARDRPKLTVWKVPAQASSISPHSNSKAVSVRWDLSPSMQSSPQVVVQAIHFFFDVTLVGSILTTISEIMPERRTPIPSIPDHDEDHITSPFVGVRSQTKPLNPPSSVHDTPKPAIADLPQSDNDRMRRVIADMGNETSQVRHQ